MFTQEEYYWAWAVYLAGALVFLICWWLLTARIKWRGFRHVSRIVMAVTVLMPWSTEPDGDYLSPAWIVCGIEGAFEGAEAFWRAGSPLLVAILSTVVASSLVYIALWLRGRGRDEDGAHRKHTRNEPSIGHVDDSDTDIMHSSRI